MTEQPPPLDAPIVLDEETTELVFSPGNMQAFLRLVLPFLDGGRRVLAYVLPASGRFAHMALEPWALLNLFGDDFDEIVVVIHDQAVLPYSEGMHAVASNVVRFVETDQKMIVLLGHYDAAPSIHGPLRVHIQSAGSLFRDQWRYFRAGNKPRYLSLPAEMEDRADGFFRDLGIAGDDHVVTLHMREGGYLADHRYHRFRNMSPANYVLAARHLLDQGHWVIRLGDQNSTPLKIDHSRFIDLPFLPGYKDFMDVVLLAKARFAICCSSGPEGPTRAFGTPMLLVNGLLDQQLFLNPNDVVQFKHYLDEATERPIPLEEILDRGLCGLSLASQFEERRILLEENTEQEILDAVKEMQARLDGTFVPDAETDARFRGITEAFVTRLEAGDVGPGHLQPLDRAFGYSLPWTNICQAYCGTNRWFLGGEP
jgi:putative glycosyltransferase (TIGR04372 family)